MVVCKFFLQGSCRFGGECARNELMFLWRILADQGTDKCRNEHPSNSNSNNPSRFGTQNRFGALANSGGGGNDCKFCRFFLYALGNTTQVCLRFLFWTPAILALILTTNSDYKEDMSLSKQSFWRTIEYRVGLPAWRAFVQPSERGKGPEIAKVTMAQAQKERHELKEKKGPIKSLCAVSMRQAIFINRAL